MTGWNDHSMDLDDDLSFFLGETAMADHIVATQARERISAQIAPDGHLPLEDTHDPDSFGCKRPG